MISMTGDRGPGEPVARAYAGIGEVSAADWRRLDPRGVDLSHAYLGFRELVEPGDPVLVVASDQAGPMAAAHGSWTTPRTALFSHPWKMLSSPQFARLPAPPDPPGQEAREYRRLLAGLAGTGARHAPGESTTPMLTAGPADGLTTALTTALGEVVVVREFDTSTVVLRPGLDGDGKRAAILAVLRRLQDIAGSRGGAVALPFVRPSDTVLRQALGDSGFRGGTVTAISVFDLPGSYERFVAALPKRRRRRYRTEQEAFEAARLSVRTVALGDHLDRLVDLEARNAERHGGTPDRDRLAVVRTRMSSLLGPALRVPVVERHGSIIAFGIDLVDADSYLGLVYGCDYSIPEHPLAYRQLISYDPIRWAADHGLSQVRLGFEAFAPKLYRGARLEPRQTWLWTPAQQAMARLGTLLDFLSARTTAYLADL